MGGAVSPEHSLCILATLITFFTTLQKNIHPKHTFAIIFINKQNFNKKQFPLFSEFHPLSDVIYEGGLINLKKQTRVSD